MLWAPMSNPELGPVATVIKVWCPGIEGHEQHAWVMHGDESLLPAGPDIFGQLLGRGWRPYSSTTSGSGETHYFYRTGPAPLPIPPDEMVDIIELYVEKHPEHARLLDIAVSMAKKTREP